MAEANVRPEPDRELVDIASYVTDYVIESDAAYHSARHCLMDALGCALLALRFPDCERHLGPVVPGTVVPHGARVPGTRLRLDPVKAAFDIGTLVRWLDFNDTWLAAEWGHPSDNLGAILALSDYLSRKAVHEGKAPLLMREVLTYLIKAYELQGVLALENSYNRAGLDHVVLVKVASTAVSAHMLGLSKDQIIDAVSHAWVDGQSLRTYRHAPNTGPRKSWAAGDATSRGVRLALMVAQGEIGMPGALSAKRWGFYDVLFQGEPFKFPRPYGSYVVENILFKISFPAEFHAQTAVECAMKLHPEVAHRLDDIDTIELKTQEPGLRIISKEGPLHNPADRDHCLQYMVAVPLIGGCLDAECYADKFASDPRIDRLRAKMRVYEDPRFTAEYYDPEKRAIGNSVQVFFRDGTATEQVTVDYPIGHRRRRDEAIPLLEKKLDGALATRFEENQQTEIRDLFLDQMQLERTPVHELMDMMVV
ncbi:MAG: bifunctional 2-methylcitrate dehydratase/aconitate hydratase [Pirellulales bacterium]